MLAVPPHLHGVIPPEITPEREYGYLRNSLYGFLLDRLNRTPQIVFVPREQNQVSDLKTLLKSKFFFISPVQIRMELELIEIQGKRPLWQSIKETTAEQFWIALETELEKLRQHFKEVQPVTPVPVAPQASKLKREDSPSLWSRINPLKAISKLFPRREEPLRVRVQVPPPSPPPGFSIPQSQSLTTSAEVLSRPTPVNEKIPVMGTLQKEPLLGPSPWQWF